MERELNRKEREKFDSIRVQLENMTPRIFYSNLQKAKIPKSVRVRPDSREYSEEQSREQSTLRVLYQRESDVPRVPHESANAYTFIGNDIESIPEKKVTAPMPEPYQPQPQSMPMPMPYPGMMQSMPSMPSMPNVPMMDPQYFNMMMMGRASQNMPFYFPKVLINNTTNKPINYRTEACRNFHSPAGCTHGDNCHFIHDFKYEGRPIPNMAEWRRTNEIRLKNLEAMKNAQLGMATYYPPAGPELHSRQQQHPQ
mmetsp:Transcript_7270/g.10744  ORF Transcript_7270/g.10744 Transcript_7270/m.10744 type:complete len:254 (-) Transcript_7270:26-787(-)